MLKCLRASTSHLSQPRNLRSRISYQRNLPRYFTTTPSRLENTPAGTVASGAADTSSATSSNPETPTAAEALSSLTPNDYMSEAERSIWDKLNNALSPTRLEVQDISGGCGSMYGIEVESEKFRGVGTLKQQRIVNEVLKEEIKSWHGIQLKTRAP